MKILIPVDGSGYSNAALAFIAARPFAQASPLQIDLLNVQLAVPPRAGRAVGAEIVRAWCEAESRAVLKPASAVLEQAGLEPAVFYRVGHPAVEIAEWAEKHAVDLIVMGSHGRTGRVNAMMGSVAAAVLADCTTPVLLIRKTTAPRRGSLRIGLAYDGSRHSRAALDYVTTHRPLFGPRGALAVAHVLDDTRQRLKSALARLTSAAAGQPDARALRQQAFDEVLAPARAALARAGKPATEHLLLGANAGDVLAA